MSDRTSASQEDTPTRLNTRSFPLPIHPKLAKILEDEIRKADVPEGRGLVLNFRDPHYSALEGGYHPVEIAVASDGSILYVTDFLYLGQPPYAELVKDLDFDASLGLFQQGGIDFPLEEGAGMFELWQHNFCVYYRMGVFRVEVEPL